MSETWASMAAEYARGGVARGNIEGAREATANRVEFRGGQRCPERCGSVVAYQVGIPKLDSITRHVDDPKACRKHAANRKTREK